MTDELLNWCKENKIYLILDLQAAMMQIFLIMTSRSRHCGKARKTRKKTIALWEKLAERYKDEPWIGGYDLINEPNKTGR